MKHLWRIVDVGEYDSVQECYHCKKRVMVSIDNPESKPPEDGCVFPQEAVKREYARLMANIRGLQGKVEELQKHCKHPTPNKKYDIVERFTLCWCPDCNLKWTEAGRT